ADVFGTHCAVLRGQSSTSRKGVGRVAASTASNSTRPGIDHRQRTQGATPGDPKGSLIAIRFKAESKPTKFHYYEKTGLPGGPGCTNESEAADRLKWSTAKCSGLFVGQAKWSLNQLTSWS